MDYKKLLESRPVRPGDAVYYVWKSKDGWRLSEERVRSVLFGEDGKLRVMITNTKEKTFIYGEDMVYRTLEEAIKQYTVLTGGIVPRPRETGPVNIVTKIPTCTWLVDLIQYSQSNERTERRLCGADHGREPLGTVWNH